MKYRKLVKQLNNLQLFRIFMERRNKTVRIKTKKKAFVSVLLSFVMIMGLFFVPKVNAEEQPDQPNTISFKAVKADMQNVDVYLEINGKMNEEPVSYASGLITEHIDSIKEQIGETTFQKAVVRNENNGQITENEIVRVGNYDGDTYYSLTGNEDTGIMLEDNEKIVLIFSSSYTITYKLTPSEGGKITSQETVYYGQALPVTISANDNYTINTINYQIGNNTSQNVDVNNTKEMQFTIPQGTITDNVVINVQFNQSTSYSINRGAINEGGICNDIGYVGMDTTTEEQIMNHAVAGETAEFLIYSQSWSGGEKHYITKLVINGENINVPLTYDLGDSEITPLSNGSIVTVTLTSTESGLYWKDGDPDYGIIFGDFKGWNKKRCIYTVTVTNVREDITVDVNFKTDNERKVTLTGLEGIEKIGMASQTRKNEIHWDPQLNGWHYYYDIQESNPLNVYDAYYISDPDVEGYNIFLYSVKPGYNPYSGHVNAIYFEEDGTQDVKEIYMQDNGEIGGNADWLFTRVEDIPPWTEISNLSSVLKTNFRHLDNLLTNSTTQGYTYAFTLHEHESRNQIVQLSVDPYQYNLVFDLDGGNLNSSQYQLQDNVYIEVNNGEQIYYTLENGDVNTYMPLETPEKDGMAFLGWQLCDSNGNALSSHIYSENELFVIDENSIQYSKGDSTKNTGHTFTFKAIWGTTTTSEETAVYHIKVYQEDENGTIVGNDGKHYTEYNTYNDIGTVGKTIRYISDETSQYNPDNNLYEINSFNSKFIINDLYDETNESWNDHNVISLYFDYQRYDLTVTKDAIGDYADLSRDWTIDVTLTNENDTDLSNKTFKNEDKEITLDNGKASLSLKDGESFTFANLIKGTQFTITETGNLNDYTVKYEINDQEITSISNQPLTSDTTVTVINKMNDESIIPDTNIPTSGMNNTITMLAIGSLGIIGIVALLWYWRKKHV